MQIKYVKNLELLQSILQYLRILHFVNINITQHQKFPGFFYQILGVLVLPLIYFITAWKYHLVLTK